MQYVAAKPETNSQRGIVMAKRKRGANEGSIYKMSDGRWRAAVSLGWKDGRRVRKVFSAKTRREVPDKLTIALRSRQLGLPVPGERQTVANFLSDWLRECAKPRVRPKTYGSYSWIVNHHLTPGLGRVRLARLNSQQIQTFLNGRRQWDLSPRTIQHIHAVLRVALSQAEKWGLVTRNAAALVDTPQVRRPEVQPMTPSEVQSFLDAIGGDRLEALFILAVAVGLRQGEALGLLWDAVDLDQGTLTVRYALQRVDKQLTLVEPKTLKSRRTLHLPQFLKAALLRHRAVQEEERLVAGSRWRETGFVFTTKIGTPLDGTNVTKRFQRLLQ